MNTEYSESPVALPADVLTLDEAYPGMAIADQVRAYADARVAAERSRIRALIADDATAATYQSMGQYRTALLRALAS